MKLLTFGFFMALFDLSLCSSMESLQFVDCHDPILNVCSRVLTEDEIKDPAMQQLLDRMFTFARGEQSDLQKHVLVGLAAPQIGLGIRVILVDVKADGRGGVSELHLYINPEIMESSQETEEWYEGCFSTRNIKGVVKRARHVQIKALDREGHVICETHSGYVARIFQHEIDHLNGIRFPERVSDQEQLHIVQANEMPAYRNQAGWRAWKKAIPQKDWKDHMR